MTRTLKLADDLTLPLEVVTQTVAILAKRRAGKSYLARRFAEQLHHAGQQVVIADPKGDWWGVRSAADGRGPGLPIVIIGGERGDVPLEPNAGEVVAKLVVEERVSALLDLSLLRKAGVATFMTGFLETLYRLKAREAYRTPMMLIIDEADAIAPQKPQRGEERMLGAAEDIVRRGGQRGIGCTTVTQRSAVLNKNVLTQAQVLVALRTIAPQDLAALKAWVDVHGTPDELRTLLGSVPSLPVGDAWVWSPGWPTAAGIFSRHHALPIETFDSGATPKPGQVRREPRMLADVDLEALRRQMADTIERAKADDPRELRKLLAERDRRIRELESQKPEPKVERVEVPVLDQGTAAGFDAVVANLRRVSQDIERQLVEARAIAGRAAATPPIGSGATSRQAGTQPVSATAQGGTNHGSRRADQALANGHDAIALGRGGDRRMLIALAQFPGGVTASKLSLLTGIARKGGTFRTYLAKLKQAGFVEGGNEQLLATPTGVAALGAFDPLPTGPELIAYWRRELGDSGMRAMFDALVAVHPGSLTKSELAERTNIAESGGTFRTYLGKLKQLELVEGRGELRAAEELFG